LVAVLDAFSDERAPLTESDLTRFWGPPLSTAHRIVA
jgi:DNA-binding IclR family transcriptional regulator